MLLKFARLCEVLSVPATRAAILGPKPRSAASALLVSQIAAEGVDFKTVIDGGANVGQFARAALTGFPHATVHSFEPYPATARLLQQNLAGIGRHRIHQAALGSTPGTAPFHSNSASQTSSLLTLNTGPGLHDGIREVEVIQVPVLTLDEFSQSEDLAEPMLLKLDLQGFELEALRGASQKLLPRCSHVLVETVFEHLYAGEPLFDEILQFMTAAGFRFERPLAFLKDPTGKVVQMDALFRNRR